MARDAGDKDNREPQPKRDNPFIKFRQFADEQISSLLQGITGLPSAFSKEPGNARWAVFDEELRRRDELISRQKQLKEWETEKTEQVAKEGIPEKSSGWTPILQQDSEAPPNDRNTHGCEIRDLPFYSPVSMKLFMHLLEESAQPPHWGTRRDIRQKFRGLPVYNGSGAVDHMSATQLHIYHDLVSGPYLRSEYSLLPYLLFSSYSPLKLASDELSSKPDALDPFPYMDAFKDLLLVSRKRPTVDTGLDTWNFRASASALPPACSYIPATEWIYQLDQANLLQQRGVREVQPESHNFTEKTGSDEDLSELLRALARETGYLDSSCMIDSVFSGLEKAFWTGARGRDDAGRDPNQDGQEKGKSNSPETEADMYERFFGIVSPSLGTSGASTRRSPFANIDKAILKELFRPDSERYVKWMKIAEEMGSKQPSDGSRSADVAAEFITDFLLPVLGEGGNAVLDRKQVESKADPATRAESVLFTSTHTERTTNEDGSVETSVTVWKRFPDGRETVTTKTHIEDRADDDQPPADTAPEAKRQEKKKDTGKKGWFWN
jgi:hypothetical protein